jgi:hypothetical protein
MDGKQNHYSWLHVPNHHRAQKQILKRHRRLKKHAQSRGAITLIFDKPRCRPKYIEPVPPEECEQIRQKFQHFGPDFSDNWDLHRLDRAGQIVTCNLYDIHESEAITAFTEKEATKLLEYMVWDYSHEDHYITEAQVDGKRQRATWKNDISPPNLTSHLSGERYFGVKKGEMTMQVTVDCDRHGGEVPGELHTAKTLKIGEVLSKRFPHLHFAPEINLKNGSVKFFGWLWDYLHITRAEGVAEQVRSALQQELPEYDFSRMEIFPSSSPQIYSPLRADKITVIGSGVLGKVKKYRMEKYNGRKRRVHYDAHSCADYLNWLFFSDAPYNEEEFERVLREAVARCPDKPAAEAKPAATEKKTPKKKRSSLPGGMGSIGKLKGRCASAMVRFWSELDVPEDDTIGKYVIVTLRILKYEGLSSDEAVEWVEDRLQTLEYTEFSDRLTDNFEELQRVMSFAVDVVWTNNGYQKDPVTSEAKLKAAVAAWSKKGFRLHDPTTWHNHKRAVVPELKLVWTASLLNLIPELVQIAHCDYDQAKRFIEKVLAFVECNNELAESMVGNLLEEVRIKGKSRQKQHDVRKLLVEKNLLLKQKNYFNDPDSGYRHGNFYICGSDVRFEEESVPHNTHTVSICYLSVDVSPVDSTSDDWLDFVMEGRRLDCDRRYGERLRQLKMLFSRAA